MKKIIAFVLALLGIGASTACSQQAFNNADVDGFAKLIGNTHVQLLDVRTAEEYAEGHIDQALNIDAKQSDFLQKAMETLDKTRPVAVYCRSGRRSANAASMLTEQGYEVVNLQGGIQAWKASQKPISTSQYEIDEFKTPGGKVVRFHALVHASIRLDIDERHIYIDPVSRLSNRSINYSTMPKADYIFITHEHGDHLDIQVLPQLMGDSTKIVTNSRCAELLLAAGIVVPKENVLKNGDQLTLANDLSLEAVPAYNITEGHQQFHPKGRDNGFIINLDGFLIYVAGDTEDIPEMEKLAPSADGDGQKTIDVAFLPCNQPYTMTTDQVVRATRIIKPRVMFPYHFGQTDVSVIPSQLKDVPVDVRLRHYE